MIQLLATSPEALNAISETTLHHISKAGSSGQINGDVNIHITMIDVIWGSNYHENFHLFSHEVGLQKLFCTKAVL